MADLLVDDDRFAQSIEDILSNVGSGVTDAMPTVVRMGVKTAAKEWRRGIKDTIMSDRKSQTYRKHGKTYTVGAYAKSIRSHMLVKDGLRPSGEVGAPKMPGLPHLLEKGHAKVGGGSVNGIEHIAPAAERAFETTVKLAEMMVDGVLDDA